MKKIVFVLGLITFLSIFVFKLWFGFFPIPIFLRHMGHLVGMPSDLYTPAIIDDDFTLNQPDYSTRYQFSPKHLDIYEIGISFKSGIDSAFKFRGRLQIEIYQNEVLIKKILADKMVVGYYSDKSLNNFKRISLAEFPYPIGIFSKRGVEIKITVLAPDNQLVNHDYNLYIAVAGRP